MRILLTRFPATNDSDTRSLLNGFWPCPSYFIYQLITRLTTNHIQCGFILLGSQSLQNQDWGTTVTSISPVVRDGTPRESQTALTLRRRLAYAWPCSPCNWCLPLLLSLRKRSSGVEHRRVHGCNLASIIIAVTFVEISEFNHF